MSYSIHCPRSTLRGLPFPTRPSGLLGRWHWCSKTSSVQGHTFGCQTFPHRFARQEGPVHCNEGSDAVFQTPRPNPNAQDLHRSTEGPALGRQKTVIFIHCYQTDPIVIRFEAASFRNCETPVEDFDGLLT